MSRLGDYCHFFLLLRWQSFEPAAFGLPGTVGSLQASQLLGA